MHTNSIPENLPLQSNSNINNSSSVLVCSYCSSLVGSRSDLRTITCNCDYSAKLDAFYSAVDGKKSAASGKRLHWNY